MSAAQFPTRQEALKFWNEHGIELPSRKPVREARSTTNPIPAGTANVTYNAPADEAKLLGKLAFEINKSRSELIREAIELFLQLKHPDMALKLRAIRNGCMCAAMLAILVLNVLADDPDKARKARRSRVIRTTKELYLS